MQECGRTFLPQIMENSRAKSPDGENRGEGAVSEAACLLVFTTVPVALNVAAFAEALVSDRLAACVSVLGEADSTYAWNGRVERSRERQVLIKTTPARWPALVEAVCRLHPYEVPELIGVPVTEGLATYLRWVSDATI
jgi:periplasmic divalent cation tolerance protein